MSETKRRQQLPFRVLLILILGAMLALLLAAFSDTSPLSRRAVLLLFAGVLLVIAIAVEIIFRDLARLRRAVGNQTGEGRKGRR